MLYSWATVPYISSVMTYTDLYMAIFNGISARDMVCKRYGMKGQEKKTELVPIGLNTYISCIEKVNIAWTNLKAIPVLSTKNF